jgi:hypothetical protein
VGERHEVARLLGEVNRTTPTEGNGAVMLIGPGRWGTSSPSLGIPVPFSQINRASVICEIVAMREDLVPDVSLGTHFLNELVEMDILYVALFPEHKDNYLNTAFFEAAPNRLVEVVPGAGRWQDAVKVIFSGDVAPAQHLVALHADSFNQKVTIYFTPQPNRPDAVPDNGPRPSRPPVRP